MEQLGAVLLCWLAGALAQSKNPAFDYQIHQFEGQCDPDGTCTYTLRLPSHESIVNPGVVDNQTAAAILAHLERHDKQIIQLLGYFGDNASDSVNLLDELAELKTTNKRLLSLINILTEDTANLEQKNKDLANSIIALNASLAGRIVIGGDYCGSKPCQNNAICQNLHDRYICVCERGYTGNNCETDINECDPNPCVHGTCNQTIGDYSCSCLLGYTGRNCQENIDECAPEPCGFNGVCMDLIGTYSCTCLPGFTGTSCQINIDECSSNPCKNNGYCLDDINGYFCACTPGYQGTYCDQDYNECLANSPCVFGQCINTNGSYDCDCNYPEITGRLCDQAPSGNCWDLRKYQNVTKDGVYTVTSPSGALILVNCDMQTDHGGWTRILNRIGKTENFTRSWDSYKYGFGDLLADYWWGNEQTSTFIKNGAFELRADMTDWEGNTAYAVYDSFQVLDESQNYALLVGKYSGTAGDAFNFDSTRFSQNNQSFTTYDRDNDPYSGNCAVVYGSGFWYNQCWSANPTGKSYPSGTYTTAIHDGIEWWPWKRDRYSLKTIDLKFRPKGAQL